MSRVVPGTRVMASKADNSVATRMADRSSSEYPRTQQVVLIT